MTAQNPTASPVAYRDISGYPGYRVGDDGSVWSRRVAGRPKNRLLAVWRRLKQHLLRGKYFQIKLRATPGGRVDNLYVHHLVLEAFVGPCPEGMEACHGPGGSKDNSLVNLRWDTPESNKRDKYLHGTVPLGELHHATTLTNADVSEMRWLKAVCPSLQFRSIAWLYGVQAAVASRAIQGKRWGHLDGAVEFRYEAATRSAIQVGTKHATRPGIHQP